MIDSGYVADFMEVVLQTVVSTFTDAGVDLPERRFITFGTPPADAEQVTVALQQLYLGSPGTPPTQPSPCSSPTTGVFRIEILRSAPVPEGRKTVVAAEIMHSAGTDTVLDAELLLKAVTRLCDAPGGGPGGLSPAMGVFADVTTPAESGALSGPIMTLTAGVP